MAKGTYQVTVTETRSYNYFIPNCNSSEEAESVALDEHDTLLKHSDSDFVDRDVDSFLAEEEGGA